MTLNEASDGFKNQGQFIAALHVSQNLGIKFTDLKATMLGKPITGATTGSTTGTTTGTSTTSTSTSSGPMSLGQAIHKLRPGVNADAETQHATTQATTDLSGK